VAINNTWKNCSCALTFHQQANASRRPLAHRVPRVITISPPGPGRRSGHGRMLGQSQAACAPVVERVHVWAALPWQRENQSSPDRRGNMTPSAIQRERLEQQHARQQCAQEHPTASRDFPDHFFTHHGDLIVEQRMRRTPIRLPKQIDGEKQHRSQSNAAGDSFVPLHINRHGLARKEPLSEQVGMSARCRSRSSPQGRAHGSLFSPARNIGRSDASTSDLHAPQRANCSDVSV